MAWTDYRELPTWAKNLYTQTRGRAKARGTPFALTREEWAGKVAERCELTGILFETATSETRHFKRPFAPSIDRISSDQGYSLENIRVVCTCVNLAMNVWGEAVLFRMAGGLMTMNPDKHRWRASGAIPRGLDIKAVPSKTLGMRYQVRMRRNGTRVHVGVYDTLEAAEAARDFALKELKSPTNPPLDRSP